ncbi:transporter [Ganoderma sinense ZZ0214-1]|uniref:Mitochondrial import inner membrane translocase subunit n=1 Tax=Ganoderma sinense ZZ0214-1 TaxID=1077348 RepID=A0A2G8SEE3_9APHY|nr:transporter [Ganoderma sinense ZZ0214-1]
MSDALTAPKLDAASQKELEQFLETEQAQARVQTQIHTLTSLCWDKCVGSISSGFSGKEQSCLENCVGRFFDASDYLIRRVEQQRAMAGAQ